MKFNINDKVVVALTEFGKQRLIGDARTIYRLDNGKYSFQLWELMSIFGDYMYNGAEQIFIKNEIELEVSIFRIESVLDSQTCDSCRFLHGAVLTKEDGLPPFHSDEGSGACRCIAKRIVL